MDSPRSYGQKTNGSVAGEIEPSHWGNR